jgi:hypothetical protein
MFKTALIEREGNTVVNVRMALVFLTGFFVFYIPMCSAQESLVANINKIDETTAQKIVGKLLLLDCPVPLKDLLFARTQLLGILLP